MAGITVKDVNSHGTITFSKLQKPEQEGKIRKNIEKKKSFFTLEKNYPLEKISLSASFSLCLLFHFMDTLLWTVRIAYD